MSRPGGGEQRFSGDDGSPDPQVAAALAAFAAGQGTEHAALTALAPSRLLVPLVPAPAEADGAAAAAGMARAALIGADGRLAIPAFTSLDALTRWRDGARPVPTPASEVWQAAAAEQSAVVIDVAGPVPLAVDGARLAALASGAAVPLPHEDPDVLGAVAAVAAGRCAGHGVRLAADPVALRREADGTLTIELTVAAGSDPACAAELAADVGAEVMARLGGRLRQDIACTVSLAVPEPG